MGHNFLINNKRQKNVPVTVTFCETSNLALSLRVIAASSDTFRVAEVTILMSAIEFNIIFTEAVASVVEPAYKNKSHQIKFLQIKYYQ